MTSNNQQLDLDERAVHVLSISGAMCGVCGDEPGDHNCADCERVRRGYIHDLRAAGWAPQEEHAALVAEVRRLRAELATAHVQAFEQAADELEGMYARDYPLAGADHLIRALATRLRTAPAARSAAV